MNLFQTVVRDGRYTSIQPPTGMPMPQLLLVFGSVKALTDPVCIDTLRTHFPDAAIVGCSTAGEISKAGVDDDSVVITGIYLQHTRIEVAVSHFAGIEDSYQSGLRLGQQLQGPKLSHVLLFGQGVNINGSALIDGLRSALPATTLVSGGLAADAGAFKQTFVMTREGAKADQNVAVGFYGDQLVVGHGSFGGWRAFGPVRVVTRAKENLLYELDGVPALEIYKKYLGEYAHDLPASGLLFPFSVLDDQYANSGLIRTILGVNESDGSLILAGDISAAKYLQLMHATTDALVDGAHAAAESAFQALRTPGTLLGLLVSCVGRKLVMGARVDEEVEAVANVLGSQTVLTGFYSNGEISPFLRGPECKLHNQTMTITTIGECAGA
ncbi:MAG: FIST C-terminal domain-containing protein [Betaproteobacteria bacterium]|nr:FIST C-terminal domain-containing protein [Betaproteobacteria bacterium]